MVYLLIILITIGLVGYMSQTSSDYLGDTFSDGSRQAQATALINAGSQIAGAATLFEVNNPGSSLTGTDFSQLTTNDYLEQTPPGPTSSMSFTLSTTSSVARVAAVASSAICSEVNKQAGFSTGAASLSQTASPDTAEFGCDASGFFYSL